MKIIYSLAISLLISQQVIAGGSCGTTLTESQVKKLRREIGEIYIHPNVMYIRYNEEEKEKIKKKVIDDKSLEIYLHQG